MLFPSFISYAFYTPFSLYLRIYPWLKTVVFHIWMFQMKCTDVCYHDKTLITIGATCQKNRKKGIQKYCAPDFNAFAHRVLIYQFILGYRFVIFWSLNWFQMLAVLTHWSRVTHMCVNRLTSINSDKGWLLGCRQAIIWANVAILLIGPSQTSMKFKSKFKHFLWRKIYLKSRQQSGVHFDPISMLKWIFIIGFVC